MDILPSACPLPSFTPTLKSFGESFASCTSLVPTGLSEGSPLAGGALPAGGVAPAGGAVLAGGALLADGVAPTDGALLAGGSAPPAGRAGSGDLPAQANASKTTAITIIVARIVNMPGLRTARGG
jgi:hypothetical protein